MNVIHLIGNLGKDPQSKLVGDKTVVNFSLATTETYKDKQGQKVTNTTWHNIEAWGKVAEVMQKYLSKGSKVQITGMQLHETYEKAGEKKFISKVKVTGFNFLNTAPNATGENSGQQSDIDNSESDINDLPF